MALLSIPEGFIAVWGEDGWLKTKFITFTLQKGDDIKIRFDHQGGGHTTFLMDGVRKTFDRQGVNDSFYHADWEGNGKSKEKINEEVLEQIKRIDEVRERAKTAVPLPGIGNHTASPKELEALRKEMTKPTGIHHFTPGGFGTGYTLSRQASPRGRRYGPAAKRAPEMEKLLGVSPLFLTTFDAD
jgi:hypothetical protein